MVSTAKNNNKKMLAGKLLSTIWYRGAWSAQHMNVQSGASEPV